MDSLVLKIGRDGHPVVAHRQHDLSGCDYQHIASIRHDVAAAIDMRGLVTWENNAVHACGLPGIVLIPDGDQADVQIRADVADPTTTISTG